MQNGGECQGYIQKPNPPKIRRNKGKQKCCTEQMEIEQTGEMDRDRHE